MDLISHLPEHILHHILCFLPIKDVVRCTILSKLWNNAWVTLPVLEFDRSFFRWVGTLRTNEGNVDRIRNRIDVLTSFVDQTLRKRHEQRISVSKLELHIPLLANRLEGGILLNQWIQYVVDSNVKDLTIDVCCTEPWYTLPNSVLVTKSITVLELRGCKLEPPIDLDLPLRKLTLSGVCVNDQIVHTLIASCPGIEELSLNNCFGLKSLKISSLLGLKYIFLAPPHGFQSVEIEALHLRSFHFFGDRMPCEINVSTCVNLRSIELAYVTITERWLHDLLSKLPFLEFFGLAGYTPQHIDMSACKSLRGLMLSGLTITTKWLHDLLSKCPHLEDFGLETCNVSGNITISSLPLKRLSLIDCKKLVEVEINTPKLLSFTYCGKKLISLSLTASELVEANLCLYPKRVDTNWYVKETDFLGKFNHCKYVSLHSFRHTNLIIIPKEERKTLLPPLLDVKHLTLNTSETLKSHEAVELVEGMLWISPQPESLYLVSGSESIVKSLKFQYEKMVERKESPCFCTSLPIICWRHCLKEVKMENFRGAEEERDVKNFFLENAEILEKIDF